MNPVPGKYTNVYFLPFLSLFGRFSNILKIIFNADHYCPFSKMKRCRLKETGPSDKQVPVINRFKITVTSCLFNFSFNLAALPKYVGDPPLGQTVAEHAVVRIICNAEGKPPPLIYWQRYGANITTVPGGVIEAEYIKGTTGGTNALLTEVRGTLKFNKIRYTDDASYSCLIYTTAGQINITSAISVECK